MTASISNHVLHTLAARARWFVCFTQVDHAASTRSQHIKLSFLTLPRMHVTRDYDPFPHQLLANRHPAVG